MVPPLELEKSPLDFLSHTCAALSGDSDTLIHSDDESSPEWLWLRLINASPSPVGRTDFAPMLIQQLCDAPTGNPLGFYRVRIHGGSVYFTCDTTRGESVPRRAAAAIRKMVEAVDKGLPNPFWPAEWDHLLTRGGITFTPWGECAPRMTNMGRSHARHDTVCLKGTFLARCAILAFSGHPPSTHTGLYV